MDNDSLYTLTHQALTHLADADLVARVQTLVGRDRYTTAEIVAHLAELDTRDVHLRAGYRSLFAYCRDVLGFSEWEAYNRIDVARAARRFPVILGMLNAGSVHLTAVRRLAPHLTPDNHRQVLESAHGRTKAEIEEIVVSLSPRPDVPTSVRRLPGHQASTAPSTDLAQAGPREPLSDAPPLEVQPVAVFADPLPATRSATLMSRVPSQVSSPAVVPLSPDRYKLQLTINGETLDRLRVAKDMLGHAVPSGDDAEVIDRALRALIAELARKKFADTPTPRSGGRTPAMHSDSDVVRKPASRHVPAAVKRAVWARDLGRCAFVGTNGHRCNATRFVEFHHVDPYALGGEATVEGIQLLCRRHNDHEGRLYFGTRRTGKQTPGFELVPEQVRLSVEGSTTGTGADAPSGVGSGSKTAEGNTPGP